MLLAMMINIGIVAAGMTLVVFMDHSTLYAKIKAFGSLGGMTGLGRLSSVFAFKRGRK